MATLMEERLEQAQTRGFGRRVKDYLDKREVGSTLTTRSIAEALGVGDDPVAVQRISAALHSASLRGYVAKVQREAGGPTVFRLDKQGDWNPREPGEPARQPLQRDETVTKRVHEYIAQNMQNGSRFTAVRIAELVGYSRVEDVNAVSAVLSLGRKKGWLKSVEIGPRGSIVYELVETPPDWKVEQIAAYVKDPTGAGATVEVKRTPATEPQTQEQPVNAAVQPTPATPVELREIAMQLLDAAAKLETYTPPLSPLSAYSDRELAEELARRIAARP